MVGVVVVRDFGCLTVWGGGLGVVIQVVGRGLGLFVAMTFSLVIFFAQLDGNSWHFGRQTFSAGSDQNAVFAVFPIRNIFCRVLEVSKRSMFQNEETIFIIGTLQLEK